MGDRIFAITICIIKDGVTHDGYSTWGIGHPPKSIRLGCNMTTDSKVGKLIPPSRPTDDRERPFDCELSNVVGPSNSTRMSTAGWHSCPLGLARNSSIG